MPPLISSRHIAHEMVLRDGRRTYPYRVEGSKVWCAGFPHPHDSDGTYLGPMEMWGDDVRRPVRNNIVSIGNPVATVAHPWVLGRFGRWYYIDGMRISTHDRAQLLAWIRYGRPFTLGEMSFVYHTNGHSLRTTTGGVTISRRVPRDTIWALKKWCGPVRIPSQWVEGMVDREVRKEHRKAIKEKKEARLLAPHLARAMAAEAARAHERGEKPSELRTELLAHRLQREAERAELLANKALLFGAKDKRTEQRRVALALDIQRKRDKMRQPLRGKAREEELRYILAQLWQAEAKEAERLGARPKGGMLSSREHVPRKE